MIDTGFILDIAFGFGMGACFFTLDPRNPATRMLSLFFVAIGLDLLTNFASQLQVPNPTALLFQKWVAPAMDALAIVCGCEWLIRIARTAERPSSLTLLLLRGAEFGGLVFPVMQVVRALRHLDATPAQVMNPPFEWFVDAPLLLLLSFAVAGVVNLARSSPDALERTRLAAFGLAAPFLMSGFVLSGWAAFIGIGLGEIIFFAGAVRYHYLQGQRGEFLSRFLSPQVAETVRRQGLLSAMQQRRVQLSVVACDLRGFTAFAETSAPEDVARLLGEYYDAMSAAIAEFGGTISNIAGDGILVVVGAPIAHANHAELAIAMGLAMRARAEIILEKWRSMGTRIGLGVGVASGYVTVGALGTGNRFEYVSVGPAVNLASRLCDQAENGQVLAEPRVVGLAASSARFDNLGERALKGLAHPINVFAAVA